MKAILLLFLILVTSGFCQVDHGTMVEQLEALEEQKEGGEAQQEHYNAVHGTNDGTGYEPPSLTDIINAAKGVDYEGDRLIVSQGISYHIPRELYNSILLSLLNDYGQLMTREECSHHCGEGQMWSEIINCNQHLDDLKHAHLTRCPYTEDQKEFEYLAI
jgi:hypothetical protein